MTAGVVFCVIREEFYKLCVQASEAIVIDQWSGTPHTQALATFAYVSTIIFIHLRDVIQLQIIFHLGPRLQAPLAILSAVSFVKNISSLLMAP